jgi:hypothetical protein
MAEISLYQVLLFFTFLLVLYKLLDGLITSYQHSRKAKKLGCQLVQLERTNWPFGIDVVLRMAKASKQQRLPDFIVERYDAMARYTWRTKLLGSEFYTTADPRNIQAILVTQFKDFRMGVARRTNLNPVLGGSVCPGWHCLA